MFYCYHGIMHDIIFREYQDKDTQSVSTFLRRIFAEMGWTVTPEDFIDDVQAGFYDKGGFFLVGDKKGNIVATAGFIQLTPTTALLKRFYVDQAIRGQGTAQILLNYTFQTLRDKGYKILFLDVDMDNSRAVHFYEKEGFEKCTVEPNSKWWESEEPEKHYFYKKHV